MNGFEIHNFFVDGFVFHNNFKERVNLQFKNKGGLKDVSNGTKVRKDYYTFEEALKS